MSESTPETNVYDIAFLQYSFQDRTSIVVTAYFSVAASFAIVLTILYENWRSQRCVEVEDSWPTDFLIRTAPAYVTPYSVAVASIFQEVIFIIVQSTGAQSLVVNKCGILSQVDWATCWTVGYTLLVLSFASLVRSIVPARLHPQGIWNILTYTTIIAVLLVLTWAPTYSRPNPIDGCPEGSSRWLETWADIGAGLTAAFIVLYAAHIAAMFHRIKRSTDMDHDQRVAMHHNICYLGAGIIIFGFTYPYWILSLISGQVGASGVVATIAKNICGVVNAVIFLILRGPRDMITTSLENQQMCRRGTWTSFGGTGSVNGIEDLMRKYEGLEGNIDLINLQEKEFEAGYSSSSDTQPLINSQRESRSSQSTSAFSAGRTSRQPYPFSLNAHKNNENVLIPPKPIFNPHTRQMSGGSAATAPVGLMRADSPFMDQRQNVSTSNLAHHLTRQGSPAPGASVDGCQISAWRRSFDALSQLAASSRSVSPYSHLNDKGPSPPPYMYSQHKIPFRGVHASGPKPPANKKLPPIPKEDPEQDDKPSSLSSKDDSPDRLPNLPQKSYTS